MRLAEGGAPDMTELDDAETERLRLAIANMASQGGAGLAFFGGASYYISGAKSVGALWIAFAGILITARGLFKIQRLSFRAWAYLSTSPLLVASFMSVLLLGGVHHSSAILIWAFFATMLNLITLGIRESRIFFAAYLVSLIIAAAIPSQMLARPSLPEWADKMMFLFNLGAASILIKKAFDFFVGERERLQKQADRLLLNVLPEEIAAALKQEPGVIAKGYDNISILFADLADFTHLSAQLPPDEVVRLLDEVFTSFDMLVDKYGVEKIKTIGDCYMAAAGVPRPRSDHAEVLASMALEMRDYIETHSFCGRHLRIRIGINSGPAVAGVIGHKKFSYDIWGDTVNAASRMESRGAPDCIQITEATYDLIVDKFTCAPMGKIEVKGKREMKVWRLLCMKAKGLSQ
jgi:adenylate cyclase